MVFFQIRKNEPDYDGCVSGIRIDEAANRPINETPMKYFANLSPGRIILWCYFIWYVFFAASYFDPGRQLWLTSLGISGVVGVALVISTWDNSARLASWQTFRLFLMPFCVSSFSALVKGHGFVLIFSPRMAENFIALGLCAVFCAFVSGVKMARR
jgi:hypothetical protein